MRKLEGLTSDQFEAREYIYESILNGQKKQAGRYINEYGINEFIEDWPEHLKEMCPECEDRLMMYEDAMKCWSLYQQNEDKDG